MNATGTNKTTEGSLPAAPVAGIATENATMNGKITFFELSELANFLAEWQKQNNTAVFEVKQDGNYCCWVLEFTGGF